MAIWKATYDAKHELGRYYGRVAFVEAESRDDARIATLDVGQVEFPGYLIIVVDLGESTTAARDAFNRKKAELAAYQARVREAQTLLCPTCLGTGRRA